MLRAFLLAALFASVVLCNAAQGAAAKGQEATERLRENVRALFRAHPELVLDVLREHSIDVLEIAQQGAQERQFRAMRAQWQEDVKIQRNINTNRPVRGNKDAKITIVAYSDYTCPYCADAAETIQQVLETRKGQVRFIFKNYPRNDLPLARLAAEYVTAAFNLDAEKGWLYHDAVFAGQMRLLKEGEGFLRSEALAQGYNLQKIGAEVKGRAVKTVVDEDIAEAQENKVPGTPFHLVNNLSVRGGQSISAFLEAVDTAASLPGGKRK